ncbi:MAG: hypothetical protein JRH20_09680 [Deltaproteobacteria bacterium]|nr:hypothetical protein [Deltaproteobacteria bacterium]
MSFFGKLPRWALDPLIRSKASFHTLDLERYRVRVARRLEEYDAAFRLVSSAYIAQGYLPASFAGKPWITPFHPLAECVVLVAYDLNDELVGTMTMTLDSPVGMPILGYYPEVAALRGPNRKLVEFNSLAVVGRCKSSGVSQLMVMAAYHLALRRLGVTDCVLEVSPKAQPLYRALFNFTPLGSPRMRDDLEIEVVGMHGDMIGMQGFVRKHYTRAMSSGLLPIEHYVDCPPTCIELPPVKNMAELTRWRMSPGIFRRLFVQASDRFATLNDHIKGYLRQSHYGQAMLATTKTLEYPMPRISPISRALVDNSTASFVAL